ncbi:hypothetical protein C799_03128 [Bacteroides thetaiotaomicron dnLKV9]|uniref:Uncharacterized protein n=1 Tax=Bacteroides thetaiotaomicron dnLKV9 TaxID=1235785 RepID=R9H5F7_BACT4|nr:hypothetical protein C799_03128 [Bacteroides thetaiotaomicron dnLKV9]
MFIVCVCSPQSYRFNVIVFDLYKKTHRDYTKYPFIKSNFIFYESNRY